MKRAHEPSLLRDPGDPVLPEGLGPKPPETRSGRAASVSLRQGSSAQIQDAELMDPANQSLADALRITFRLLQLAMLVLLGLFLLSGFQSVKENERGIRLLFGRVVTPDLPPGFQFSAPYPVGELVKVDQGTKDARIEDAFWFFMSDQEKALPLDRLAGKQRLNPANDGSLITADGNLVHSRWQVRYRRADATRFVQNLYSDHEDEIVAAAAKRGIVQAVARTNIDDLLKQTDSDEASVAIMARKVAQDMLDRNQSGIIIEQLRMIDRTAPTFVRAKFVGVQTAAQNAGQEREKAEAEARQILNSTAGNGVQLLLDLIAKYELAVEKKDETAKTSLLTQIDLALDGQPIASGAPPVDVSGRVATILSQARQYRSEIVSRRQRELETFRAKEQQFRSNPLVMVHREWEEGLRAFLGRESTQIMALPPRIGTVEVVINTDPDILRDMYRTRKREEAAEAREQRMQDARDARFQTQQGLRARE